MGVQIDLPQRNNTTQEETETVEEPSSMAAPQIKGNFLETDQVLVDKNGFVRTLTLNRPKQLNALSSQMILKMLELFIAYEKDPNVRLLIVKGNGRAFCAGGDVTGVAHAVNNGHWTAGANYFWNEYVLNYVIATYTKPQVSLLNGIVMGGGAGISIHGRFRVVTEKTVFAMPETALGLFPDVGASYFLSRLPGYFGEYVGLTGKRLDGSEMLASGLATHFVPSEKLELLEQSLFRMTSSNPSAICRILDSFSQHIPLKDNSILCSLDKINKCFSGRTVEGILFDLEQEAILNHDDWISSSIESIKKASPTSLKITLKAIRDGRMLEIDQCLIQEYRMCCHLMRKELTNDYFEGCRAILIDRDRNPKWEPSKMDMITDVMVDQYFAVVDDTNWEDLKLPERHRLNISSMSKL